MKQVIRRIAAGLLSAGLLLSFTPRARQIAELPSEIVLPAGQAGALSELLPFQPLQSAYTAAAASYDEQLAASGESQVTLSMLGVPVTPWISRPSFCVPSRTGKSPGWAEPRPAIWISAFSP